MGKPVTVSVGRRMLERWARGKSFWRRLPPEFGRHPIRVSPDARLRHLMPGWTGFDAWLLRAARRYVEEKSVVWDVGANVGVFSVAAAFRASKGKVLAIEPDPWLVGLLRQTFEHRQNRRLRLTVLGAAVGPRCGLSTLVIAERGRASNRLESVSGRRTAGGARETQVVPMLTLDQIAAYGGFPHLVKIDCEGAELEIVHGGRGVFEVGRPMVLIEVDQGSGPEVVEWFQKREYSVFDAHEGGPWPRDLTETRNVLAIPTEHV